MKNILVLSYYFYPDLSAGSFRNTALVKELAAQLGNDGVIHVITTQPNRYKSFSDEAAENESWGSNVKIHRIKVPAHQNGFRDQVNSYKLYYTSALKLIKGQKFDLVYASSSKLFTAFLGKTIASRLNCPLYLDVRDIFVETMVDVLRHRPFFKSSVLKMIEIFIERPTFRKAVHINLVSEGFKDYFKNITKSKLSFYPNGIDDVFLGLTAQHDNQNGPKVITYAGNIGEGQGLEKIIPAAAKELGNGYHFKIIGDGGTRRLLEKEINDLALTNVEIINPLKRNDLIEIYRSSHFLFLHLNDYKAFESVLPSKIFEYGATNLPMIAGVNGYAKTFIDKHVSNSFTFDPCNVSALVNHINSYNYTLSDRFEFVNKFKRTTICRQLAISILSYVHMPLAAPAKNKVSIFTDAKEKLVFKKLLHKVS